MHYIATFHPQAWIDDQATAVDPLGPTQWDVCAFLNSLPQEARAEHMQRSTDESDRLRDIPAAPQWIRDWMGPFSISVEEVERLPGDLAGTHRDGPAPVRYQIQLSVDVDSTTTSQSAREHAEAVIAEIEARIARGLLTRHDSAAVVSGFQLRQSFLMNDRPEETCAPEYAQTGPPHYRITVKALIPRDELDHDDEMEYDDIVGEHQVEAKDEDEALDEFHGTVAIACLEDFAITCERLRNFRVHWSCDIPDAANPYEAARVAFDAIRLDTTTATTFSVVDHASNITTDVRVDLTEHPHVESAS